ncbi:efflux RND transporter periplasmic adaptor subunit [Rhizobium leguminosarum]|nr:efflux RND transporter periplasmic adaptor subunit [Rhizobium leguminosarum]NEJ47479.1 efflux RND transporter periplasmic adaptor subunit [Rhizobium leguminosarum]NEJ54428.1 efflux RND transporter periplasmic adaptor subunit [Rhizobium leguminosarum]NEJ82589.1 efflux RND transporter periplasmic adaptor subunit [Rhizobium leguminosarum]
MSSRVLACAAGAFAMLLSACSDETVPPKTPRAVRVVTVKSEFLGETFSQTGEIRPRYEVPMSFRINGQLAFRIDNGSTVKEGDTLATLEKTPSRISVVSATAQVDEAKSEVHLTEVTAARNWELFAKNAISRAQVEQSDATLHAAKSKLEVANAALASAQQTLSYTDLKAGRNGIVSGVSANVGQVASAGQTILTLSSNTELDAVFDIPEQLWSNNLYDTEVEVCLISNPAFVAKGKVREVTPSADAATRTYRVKVSLESAMDGIPMGAAVTGKVILSPKRLFQVPASALTGLGKDQTVFVYAPETKTLMARIVKIERYAENDMFISEGLVDGEIVATAGVSKLRDGEPVTIEKGDQP